MAVEDKVRARIDAGAKMLWKLIEQAEAGAAEMCDEGQLELSAGLHMVAADLRKAYARGRMLKDTDGEFVAFSGGK